MPAFGAIELRYNGPELDLQSANSSRHVDIQFGSMQFTFRQKASDNIVARPSTSGLRPAHQPPAHPLGRLARGPLERHSRDSNKQADRRTCPLSSSKSLLEEWKLSAVAETQTVADSSDKQSDASVERPFGRLDVDQVVVCRSGHFLGNSSARSRRHRRWSSIDLLRRPISASRSRLTICWSNMATYRQSKFIIIVAKLPSLETLSPPIARQQFVPART